MPQYARLTFRLSGFMGSQPDNFSPNGEVLCVKSNPSASITFPGVSGGLVIQTSAINVPGLCACRFLALVKHCQSSVLCVNVEWPLHVNLEIIFPCHKTHVVI
jgi:hypothetical protein